MLIADNSGHKVESHGVTGSEVFPIVNSSFMYNILSNGLYADKIAAVIREPACNAADSHIMAGTPDLPIEVKLPNALSPTFHVKDWGVGLSDEEVRNIYTSYGKSTKRESEETTGAFGLGSKAPFAYTSEDTENAGGFSVTAVKNGVKNVYTCYFNEAGLPSLSKLFSGPADEDWPHGVMVSFSVRTADISTFQRKALEVFKWFTVKPNVVGKTMSSEEPTFYLKTELFNIGVSNEPAVVMGNVRYPLSVSSLRDTNSIEQILLSNGLHLNLPLGTVLMTPSREALQYFSSTIEKIRPYLTEVTEYIAGKLFELFEKYSQNRTWNGRREYLRSLHSFNLALGKKLPEFIKTLSMEYPQLISSEKASELIRSMSSFTPLPRWLGSGNDDVEVSLVTEKLSLVVRGGFLYKRGKLESIGEATLDARRNCCIVYANSTHLTARLKEALQTKEYSSIVVVKKGKDCNTALSIAKRIAEVEELQGIEVLGSDTLALPAKLINQRNIQQERKAVRTKSPKGFKVDGTVGFTEQSEKLSFMPLSSVPNSMPLFYAVSKSQSLARGVFSNEWNKELLVADLNGFDAVFNKVNFLSSFFEEQRCSLIVVPSEAEAKRLQLVEKGIKPFLFWIRDTLKKNVSRVAEFEKTRSLLPSLSASSSSFDANFGLLGALDWIDKNDKIQFEKMSNQFKRTSTWKELVIALRRVQISQQQKRAEQAIIESLQLISHSISGKITKFSDFQRSVPKDLFIGNLFSIPMHNSLNYEFLSTRLAKNPSAIYPLIESVIKQIHASRMKNLPLF